MVIFGENPQDVRQYMKTLDLNQDGSVDFNEFLAAIAKSNKIVRDEKTTTDERFRNQFKAFDKDGNGKLSKEELKNVLKELGCSKDLDEEVTSMINKVDLDGDGQINYVEFVKLMMSSS